MLQPRRLHIYIAELGQKLSDDRITRETRSNSNIARALFFCWCNTVLIPTLILQVYSLESSKLLPAFTLSPLILITSKERPNQAKRGQSDSFCVLAPYKDTSHPYRIVKPNPTLINDDVRPSIIGAGAGL